MLINGQFYRYHSSCTKKMNNRVKAFGNIILIIFQDLFLDNLTCDITYIAVIQTITCLVILSLWITKYTNVLADDATIKPNRSKTPFARFWTFEFVLERHSNNLLKIVLVWLTYEKTNSLFDFKYENKIPC